MLKLTTSTIGESFGKTARKHRVPAKQSAKTLAFDAVLHSQYCRERCEFSYRVFLQPTHHIVTTCLQATPGSAPSARSRHHWRSTGRLPSATRHSMRYCKWHEMSSKQLGASRRMLACSSLGLTVRGLAPICSHLVLTQANSAAHAKFAGQPLEPLPMHTTDTIHSHSTRIHGCHAIRVCAHAGTSSYCSMRQQVLLLHAGTLYDQVLDTTYWLGVIPKRFQVSVHLHAPVCSCSCQDLTCRMSGPELCGLPPQ